VKLSKEQRKKVDEWMSERWTQRKCPDCGHSTWSIDMNIFEMREFLEGKINISGYGYLKPVLVLTCENCGHLKTFNAVKIGIVQAPFQDTNSEKEE